LRKKVQLLLTKGKRRLKGGMETTNHPLERRIHQFVQDTVAEQNLDK